MRRLLLAVAVAVGGVVNMNCDYCKRPLEGYAHWLCEVKAQREAQRKPRHMVYDGRECKHCGGNMTAEDFKYCSDRCRDEVRSVTCQIAN